MMQQGMVKMEPRPTTRAEAVVNDLETRAKGLLERRYEQLVRLDGMNARKGDVVSQNVALLAPQSLLGRLDQVAAELTELEELDARMSALI